MQVTRAEFVLLWATYLAIMYTDLERGIGAGIVMATLYFAYSYAKARALAKCTPKRYTQTLSLAGISCSSPCSGGRLCHGSCSFYDMVECDTSYLAFQ